MAFVAALPLRHTRCQRPRSAPRRQARRACPRCCAPPPPAVSARVAAFLAEAQEGDPAEGLRRADAAYARTRAVAPRAPPPPDIVTVHGGAAPAGGAAYDAAVAGGTLGLFVALALQLRGFRTAVVERGRVAGREQEWNVSRGELAALTAGGLVTQAELDACIVSEWKTSRIALQDTPDGPPSETFVDGVLNCGVSPAALLAVARARYEAAGGAVLEYSTICAIDVYDDDAVVLTTGAQRPTVDAALGAGGDGIASAASASASATAAATAVRARLLVDCLGSFSPVAAQARGHAPPDGICTTVGSCCTGAAAPSAPSDLLAAIDPVSPTTGQQSFWESFPAAAPDGGPPRRTTYMFQYGGCSASRPSLADTLDAYLDALPRYLGAPLASLTPVRVLFGFFPAHRDAPLRTPFPRIFFAGDAGGTQSPVSFGGFGSLLRHLPRLTPALSAALLSTPLTPPYLRLLAPYLPSTSAAWLFASAMSSTSPSPPLLGPYGINRLLAANMSTLARLGAATQRPFLQDVIQAGGLARTLLAMVAGDPVFALQLLPHVGAGEAARFAGHFAALAAYAAADRAAEAAGLGCGGGFRAARAREALRWGSGRDHGMHDA